MLTHIYLGYAVSFSLVACHDVRSTGDRLFPAWHHTEGAVELRDESWLVRELQVHDDFVTIHEIDRQCSCQCCHALFTFEGRDSMDYRIVECTIFSCRDKKKTELLTVENFSLRFSVKQLVSNFYASNLKRFNVQYNRPNSAA
jgi:hypothetical protein